MRIARELSECGLNILILNENNIGSQGVVALSEALAEHQTINFFDLGYNQIGDQGAVAFARNLLRRYIPLKRKSFYDRFRFIMIGLDLDGNSLKTKDIKSINNQVKRNK